MGVLLVSSPSAQVIATIDKSFTEQLRVAIVRHPGHEPHAAVHKWRRGQDGQFRLVPGNAGIPSRLLLRVAAAFVKAAHLIEGGAA